LSALRLVGYNDIVAIEHEDSLMSPEEGLSKATHFLQELIMRERSGTWWGVQ
jgi:sugar phosphate isomerase/epimerase